MMKALSSLGCGFDEIQMERRWGERKKEREGRKEGGRERERISTGSFFGDLGLSPQPPGVRGGEHNSLHKAGFTVLCFLPTL